MQFLVSMDLQLNGAVGAQLAIIDRASGIYILFVPIIYTHFLLEPDYLCRLCFLLYLRVSVVRSSSIMRLRWKATCGGQGCMNTVLTQSACVGDNNQSRTCGYLS